jgi:hypothetical protein
MNARDWPGLKCGRSRSTARSAPRFCISLMEFDQSLAQTEDPQLMALLFGLESIDRYRF